MSHSPRRHTEEGEASDSGNEAHLTAASNELRVELEQLSSLQPTAPVSEEEDAGEEAKNKEKKKKHHKHHREKERRSEDDDESSSSGDEEERIRRRLLERREKGREKEKKRDRVKDNSEEEELFTIQPPDVRPRHSARSENDERRDRDRDRDRERERDRDRHRYYKLPLDPRRDERSRHSEQRWGGRMRMDEKGSGRERERERVGDSRRHQLSRSRTPIDKRKEKKEREVSPPKKEEKQRTPPGSEDVQAPPPETSEEKKPKVDDEAMEAVDEAEIELEENSYEEVVEERIEETIVTAIAEETEEAKTEADIIREINKKKYSKFDSSPEDYHVLDSPDDDLTDEDEAMQAVEEEEDALFDPDMPFEEMTQLQRERLSPESLARAESSWQSRMVAKLPVYFPGISGCRNVIEFDCLNRIEEGTFGVVYRAKDKRTDEVVALKRLKMEKEKEGFPITSLREVNMLLKSGGHENVVNVKEIVIGSNYDKIFLVMEFVEHDMKALMETMKKAGKKFSIGETKTLMKQLLSGIQHLHNLWILHRDLKTSNLLLSHKSVLKIGDFGLAREYGNPLKAYTQVVVTLWYRSPELLLGIKKYSTAVDMWSAGCIMGEFFHLMPLFPGKGEIDQVNRIFTELGTPTEKIWPGFDNLPGPKQVSFVQHQYNQLRKKFPASLLSEQGFKLLNAFLTYDPEKRCSAGDSLESEWFKEAPEPTAREMFPTWPAKSEMGKKPPPANNALLHASSPEKKPKAKEASTAFTIKFDQPHF